MDQSKTEQSNSHISNKVTNQYNTAAMLYNYRWDAAQLLEQGHTPRTQVVRSDTHFVQSNTKATFTTHNQWQSRVTYTHTHTHTPSHHMSLQSWTCYTMTYNRITDQHVSSQTNSFAGYTCTSKYITTGSRLIFYRHKSCYAQPPPPPLCANYGDNISLASNNSNALHTSSSMHCKKISHNSKCALLTRTGATSVMYTSTPQL